MIRSKLILTVASATLALATVQSSRAQTNTNLYPAVFRAICISTNTNGIVYKRFGNSNLIQQCATQLGVSNVNNLRLVYNAGDDSLQVIASTNQANPTNLTCTALSFDGGTSFSNPSNTVIERLAFVYVGTNQTASGILSATERLTYGSSNQITAFRLNGRLTYTTSASGTNAGAIYKGVLVAGTNVDEDEDNDHPGNGPHGNNGNHFGWDLGVGNPHGNGNNGNQGVGNPNRRGNR
jgi:hypothetical protein